MKLIEESFMFGENILVWLTGNRKFKYFEMSTRPFIKKEHNMKLNRKYTEIIISVLNQADKRELMDYFTEKGYEVVEKETRPVYNSSFVDPEKIKCLPSCFGGFSIHVTNQDFLKFVEDIENLPEFKTLWRTDKTNRSFILK